MKKYIIIALFAISFTPTFQGCKLFQRVQITSPYNAELVRDVKDLAFTFDLFSVTMLESPEKGYNDHIPDYNAMEALAASIKERVSAMPKSGLMQRQASDVLDIIIKYKKYHKDNAVLNDSEIRTNRDYFKGHIRPLIASSSALK